MKPSPSYDINLVNYESYDIEHIFCSDECMDYYSIMHCIILGEDMTFLADDIKKHCQYPEYMRVKKEQGVKLGRPKGKGKSKLDKHREEIVVLLNNGSTKIWVSKRYDTTSENLYHWMNNNNIKV